MRILFVTMTPIQNNTSASIINRHVIKALHKLGHNVDVLSSEPDNRVNSFENDLKLDFVNYYYLKKNVIYDTFKNKKNYQGLKGILIKNIRRYIRYVYSAFNIYDAQKRLVNMLDVNEFNDIQYDMIISASDPKSSHLLAIKFMKLYNVSKTKYIQYWGDPMYADITNKYIWKKPLLKSAEKKLIKEADSIIYVSPFTLELQKKLYPDYKSKMHCVLPNYVDKLVESFALKSSKKIKIGYFGAYNSKIRNIVPFYKAAQDLDSIETIICGSSDLDLKSTNQVSIKGYTPYVETHRLEEECDILVCLCNKKGTQIPGKIYYNASFHKPIIVIVDGEYSEEIKCFLEKFNRYIICNNDKEDIKRAIILAEKSIYSFKLNLPQILAPDNVARNIISSVFREG